MQCFFGSRVQSSAPTSDPNIVCYSSPGFLWSLHAYDPVVLSAQLVVVDEKSLQLAHECFAQVVNVSNVGQAVISFSTATTRSLRSLGFASPCSPSIIPINRHGSQQTCDGFWFQQIAQKGKRGNHNSAHDYPQ